MTTISEDASMYQSHGFDADADSDADTEAEAATADPSSSSSVIRPIQAPVEAIEKLCQRNNYPMVQENGQRCYGPPPDWMGPAPKRGCEVFVGSIPRDCFEDELVPIFEIVGPIYMFQLMLDLNGFNRGWGFCVYTSREHAREAEDRIDRFEIRPDKKLGVRQKVDNCRLFVGGIPKDKVKEEIMQEMQKVTEGVRNVIIVQPMLADRCAKNRGFAFVEYESNNAASRARYNLYLGRIQLWGQTVAGDWAQPEHVPLSGNSEIRRWTKYI